jgi:hypothetical protein
LTLTANEKYLVEKISSDIKSSLGLNKPPKQVICLEVEAWGQTLTVPIPPEAKGKRVRIRMELIE